MFYSTTLFPFIQDIASHAEVMREELNKAKKLI